MDPLSLLLEGDPQQADARALAEAYRRRQGLGSTLQFAGNPRLAQAGQRIQGDAAGQVDQLLQALTQRRIGQQQQVQNQRLAQSDEFARQQAGEKMGLDRLKLALDRDELNLRREVARQPKQKQGSGPDDLRKEFQGQQGYKDFQTVSSAFKKIQSTSDTGAGDISLVYGYMKLLDPGSTVREGEFATAANAGSAFDRAGTLYNKVLNGEKLSPNVRKQFKDEAAKVYAMQRQEFDRIAQPYIQYAGRQGLDPADVIFGYEPPASAPAEAAPAAQRAQGKDGKWYRLTEQGWEAE